MMREKCPGRPKRFRCIEKIPEVSRFCPVGNLKGSSELVNLTVDELEAVRLADLESLYHEQAALKLKISRQTFGRIINSAHRKIAEALVNGKSLLIEGGEIITLEESNAMGAGGYCICPKCNERLIHQRGQPCQEKECPKCGHRMMREGSYHHQLLRKKRSK